MGRSSVRIGSFVAMVALIACGGDDGDVPDGGLDGATADGGSPEDGRVPPRVDGGLSCFPPPSGACTMDSECDDGLRCNGIAICNLEFGCVCDPERPVVDCSDGIACTEGTCLEPSGNCEQVPNHDSCDDGNDCTRDVCDVDEGCQNMPVEDGTSCGDGDSACVAGNCCEGCWDPDAEACRDGDTVDHCGGPGELCDVCEDDNECTDDSCTEDGCVQTPVTDGTPCEGGACSGGECCGGCVDFTDACQPGDDPLVCGIAGALCRRCECPDTDTCDGGRCPPGMYAVRSVAAGHLTTCAITGDGRLYCWGDDGNGQVGDGEPLEDRLSPTRVGTESDWDQVSVSVNHACGIRTDGADPPMRTLWCWGQNGAAGRLGDGSGMNSAVPVQEASAGTDWAEVGTGDNFTCARTSGNTLFCWGSARAQLGACGEGTAREPEPFPVGGTSLRDGWAQLTVGFAHACAIRMVAGGGRELYCWGAGGAGRLGIGDAGSRECPTRVGTDTDWQRVVAGDDHTCAIKTDGTLWCWGNNSDGRLGIGTAGGTFDTPQQVGTEADWTDVFPGGSHTCGIRGEGELYCWGRNSRGATGFGSTVGDTPEPTRVGSFGAWVSGSAGDGHTCGIRDDGTLWCWGDGSNGVTGHGDLEDRDEEERVCWAVGS